VAVIGRVYGVGIVRILAVLNEPPAPAYATDCPDGFSLSQHISSVKSPVHPIQTAGVVYSGTDPAQLSAHHYLRGAYASDNQEFDCSHLPATLVPKSRWRSAPARPPSSTAAA
jgi:hypothetical protein